MKVDEKPEITVDATGAGNGENSGNGPANVTPAFTFTTKDDLQAYIEQALKERLDREKVKAERAAQAAAEAATAEAAAKNGEWQALADSRAKKLDTVTAERDAAIQQTEALQGQLDRAMKALGVQVETMRKGLPEAVTALLGRLDAVDQLEWLASNAAKLTGQLQAPKAQGVPPTPKATPAGSSAPAPADAKPSFYRDF